MRVLGYSETVAALDFPPLVEALRQAFRKGTIATPPADVFAIPVPESQDGSLILLPAWQPGRNFGIKLTMVFPGKGEHHRAERHGSFLLCDGKTGEQLALLDGPALTARRTAAASALAAS